MRKAFLSKGVYVDGKELPDYGFVVEGENFTHVLSNEEIKKNFPRTKQIYLDGFVYPGVIDSHVHLKELAFSLGSVNASNVHNFEELVSLIESTKEDPIYIYNLDFNTIIGEQWLKLYKIDRKVFIQSKDVHSIFVSKAFLTEKRIFPRSVSGGELGFYKSEFIGIFKDKATELLTTIKERPFSEDYFPVLEDYFLSRGTTAVVNFDCDLINMENLLRDKFKLRVIQAIHKDAVFDAVKRGIKTGDGDSKFRIGAVKLFLDGSLGSQTAFMYYRKPFRGILSMGEGEFKERVQYANENGLQVAVHAIGSGAVYYAMKAFKNGKTPKITNRIEHLQFIEEEHVDLMKESNFIASMQPVHAISDYQLYMKYLDGFNYAYAWKTVKNSNKMLIFGSDAPVDDASFLLGIYAATTRKTLKEGLSYLEGETVDIPTAVAAYTKNGFNAVSLGDRLGEIKEGKIADFIVLRDSLFAKASFNKELLSNQVLKTFINGREIWMK